MKKIQQIITNKIFYLFFVPLMLFLFGVLFGSYYIFTYQVHFTVMPVRHTDASVSVPNSKLTEGKVFKGEFVASKNNLGSVALPIKNESPDGLDDYSLTFRIKEKGAKEWHSSNTYEGGQFHELDLFPFGFGIISDSQDKTYVFEVFTKDSSEQNAPIIDSNQRVVANYQLNKSDLKNPIVTIQYVLDKVRYIFDDSSAVLTALIFFLPLYTYFYLIYEKNRIAIPTLITTVLLFKFLQGLIVSPAVKLINLCMSTLVKFGIVEEYKSISSVSLINIILVFIIFIEIFFIQGINNTLLLLIVIMWGITIIFNKFELYVSFVFAMLFLLLSFVLYCIGLNAVAEKAAIWVYLFLVIGAIHGLVTIRKSKPLPVTSKPKVKSK